MEHFQIFSATLGLTQAWEISSVSFSDDEKRVDIVLKHAYDSGLACPLCGTTGQPGSRVNETWHHDSFFSYTAYLHARVPRVHCTTCGTSPVERPWTRDGSKFVHMP